MIPFLASCRSNHTPFAASDLVRIKIGPLADSRANGFERSETGAEKIGVYR